MPAAREAAPVGSSELQCSGQACTQTIVSDADERGATCRGSLSACSSSGGLLALDYESAPEINRSELGWQRNSSCAQPCLSGHICDLGVRAGPCCLRLLAQNLCNTSSALAALQASILTRTAVITSPAARISLRRGLHSVRTMSSVSNTLKSALNGSSSDQLPPNMPVLEGTPPRDTFP